MHTSILELVHINNARIIDHVRLCIVDNNQVIWKKGFRACSTWRGRGTPLRLQNNRGTNHVLLKYSCKLCVLAGKNFLSWVSCSSYVQISVQGVTCERLWLYNCRGILTNDGGSNLWIVHRFYIPEAVAWSFGIEISWIDKAHS